MLHGDCYSLEIRCYFYEDIILIFLQKLQLLVMNFYERLERLLDTRGTR